MWLHHIGKSVAGHKWGLGFRVLGLGFEVPHLGPDYTGNPTIWGSTLGVPYFRTPHIMVVQLRTRTKPILAPANQQIRALK